jgi:hypothetical protein
MDAIYRVEIFFDFVRFQSFGGLTIMARRSASSGGRSHFNSSWFCAPFLPFLPFDFMAFIGNSNVMRVAYLV